MHEEMEEYGETGSKGVVLEIKIAYNVRGRSRQFLDGLNECDASCALL